MHEMQAPGSTLAATGCGAAQYGSWCASPVGSARTAYTQPYGGMHLEPDPQAAACWGTSGACQHRPFGYASGGVAHGTPTHMHAAGGGGLAYVPQAVGYGMAMASVPAAAAGQDGRAGEGEGEGNGPSEALLSMLQQCHRRVSGSLADVAGMQ